MKNLGSRTVILKDTLVSITCDICKHTSDCSSWENWENENYDIAKTEVNVKLGNRGSYGGSEVTKSFDICPQCFESHVIPFLNSLGAKETVTERDW